MVKKQTFEKAMKQLEQIVLELESGDSPLDKALQKFEEGIQLARFCSEKLDETEKKVTMLIQDQNGEAVDGPFSPDTHHSE